MKTALKALSMGFIGVSAIAANAQTLTLSPGDPKLVSGLVSALSGYTSVEVLDTAVDAAGNRYVVGRCVNGTNTDGFIAALAPRPVKDPTPTKKTVLWANVINLGGNEYASAVAIDASGNAFVSINATTNLAPRLQKYDSTGVLQFTETFPYPGQTNDLILTQAGVPVSFGAYNGTQPMAQIWTTNGTNPAAAATSYKYYAYTGAFKSATIAPNGDIYMTGTASISGTNNPFVGIINPALTNATLNYYTGIPSTMKEVKVDPVTGVAIGIGYYTSGGIEIPFAVTAKGATTSSSVTLPALNYITADYSTAGGGRYSSVETSPDGTVYLAVNGGSSIGPRYTDVYAYKINPVAPADTTITAVGQWADEVPAIDVVTNLSVVDLVAHDGQISLLAADERPVTSGAGVYRGYNLFTWDSAGNRLDRRVFGSADQQIPTTVPLDYPQNVATYGGGVLNLYAASMFSQAGLWTAGSITGPDDTYTTLKNVTVSQDAGKGSLLDNDLNGFVEGLTATVTPNSAMHLSNVTVNSDGSFSATPDTAFVGTASFQYDVYNGATYVATHTATIRVKNDHVPPVAIDDSMDIGYNSAKTTIHVLENDSDPSGGTISLTAKTNPMNGTVLLAPDKLSLTYKPKKGFTGIETFQYTIKNNNGDTATATVTVNVQQPS